MLLYVAIKPLSYMMLHPELKSFYGNVNYNFTYFRGL